MEKDDPKEPPVSFSEGVQGIWRHASSYKSTLVLVGVLGLISAIANGFVPYVTGRFFDALIAISQGNPTQSNGLPYIALVLIAWAVTRIVSDFVDWWIDRKRRWLDTDMHIGVQAEGFIHLLQLPLSFHTQEHIQAVFSRISSASWRINAILRTAIQISPQLLSIVIGITLALSINTTLALILTAGVIVYACALVILLQGTASVDDRAHRAWNDRWDDAASAVSQSAAVKQAAAEEYEIARIRKTLKGDVVALWYKNELNWNRLNLWQRVIVFLTQASIFIVSVQYVSAGIITVGELVAFNGYALMFFGPLVSLGYSWQVIQNGLTTAGSVERIFRKPQEIYHPANAHNSGPLAGVVEFRDVSFRYEEEQRLVLSHLSFSTKPGQVTAFVGESGVGKSSAISLISGYYFPTEGKVLVEGVDTREWDLLALRSRIAVVPQEVALFNDTIRSNIRYGSFSASDAEVEHAAQEAHIHDFIMLQAKGYDTIVGERGIKLSVGQKQRVAIARAILRNPEFLILDEPTSALDIETEQLITASLEKLMRDRTTFIIAHRLSTVRKADKILVIKDGGVAEEGTHEELLAKEDGTYRHLYNLHVGLHE
ncbi:ABC transporter ATP-binding protein [Candidatus Kaiserbacteria bacterium]|nr:ABC transporter ATP-binding protein [Candidatus Kaiserbacteria bacterium]